MFFSSNKKSNASEQTVFEEAHDAAKKSSSSSKSSPISKECGPNYKMNIIDLIVECLQADQKNDTLKLLYD